MTKGIYNALSGAVAHQREVDLIAENVANAGTAGYRAKKATFAQVLDRTAPMVHTGETESTAKRGIVKETGNPLDLALKSDGWFMVGTPNGARLTRDGAFGLDGSGRIVDGEGNPVLSRSGADILVPPGEGQVSVDADGRVTVGDFELGAIAVVRVPESALESEGSRYRVAAGVEPAEVMNPGVQAGALEGANFNVIEGMVDLIRASRAHEAAARMIQTMSEVDRRAARDIGKG